MRTRLLNLWYQLRSSLWFVPGLLTLLGFLLAIGMVAVDSYLSTDWIRTTRWLSAGDANGARAILSTIAGSMITVAGVTFSITVVALSLASSQFGPRLLSNFMRDRGNQVVLGTFIGTFLYCAVVLQLVQSGFDQARVPYIAVTGSVLLAVVSMGVLIYFIHHVATSIQADQVIANVSDELDDTIERLLPQQFDAPVHDRDDYHLRSQRVPDTFHNQAAAVKTARTGYLRAISSQTLISLLSRRTMVTQLLYKPGEFVVEGLAIAMAWPPDQVDDDFVEHFNDALVIGNTRTMEQDIEYGIDQLVEVAVRALSPGVNDPFTAIACIDRLTTAMCKIGTRDLPSTHRCHDDGRLCMIMLASDFTHFVNLSFNQIRQYGRSDQRVMLRLLNAIDLSLQCLGHIDDRREALLHQAKLINDQGQQSIQLPADRDRLAKAFTRLQQNHSKRL